MLTGHVGHTAVEHLVDSGVPVGDDDRRIPAGSNSSFKRRPRTSDGRTHEFEIGSRSAAAPIPPHHRACDVELGAPGRERFAAIARTRRDTRAIEQQRGHGTEIVAQLTEITPLACLSDQALDRADRWGGTGLDRKVDRCFGKGCIGGKSRGPACETRSETPSRFDSEQLWQRGEPSPAPTTHLGESKLEAPNAAEKDVTRCLER